MSDNCGLWAPRLISATVVYILSAILEFYFWFRFRPYHRSRHVIVHQSVRNFTQIGPPLAEKNDVMSTFKMADLRHL